MPRRARSSQASRPFPSRRLRCSSPSASRSRISPPRASSTTRRVLAGLATRDLARRRRRIVSMSGLDILFLSKEDVDAVDLGLDEAMAAVEMGLRAHGERKVVMPSKDHLALDRSERHWNILKGYVEPIDVAGVKVIGDFEGNYRFGLASEVSC